VDALAVLDIGAGLHDNNITQAHTQILADNLVHADLCLLAGVIGKDNTHGVLALLALDEDSVTTEKRELLHGVEVERNDAIVVIDGIVNDEAVGVLLLDGFGGCCRRSLSAR